MGSLQLQTVFFYQSQVQQYCTERNSSLIQHSLQSRCVPLTISTIMSYLSRSLTPLRATGRAFPSRSVAAFHTSSARRGYGNGKNIAQNDGCRAQHYTKTVVVEDTMVPIISLKYKGTKLGRWGYMAESTTTTVNGWVF